MKKKIYLHIGTHKTGTTSFQQLIRKNARALELQDIYVPPVGKLTDGDVDYQMHGGGLHLICSAFRGKVDFNVIDAYLRNFERSGCTSACISSEGFDSLNKNQIDKISKTFDSYDIKILLVLRHPLSLAKSFFCSRGGVRNVTNFDFLDATLNMRRFNYSSLINDYSNIGDVIVFKYDDFNNINDALMREIKVADHNLIEVEKKLRKSIDPYIAIANQQIYSAFGVDEKIYLKTIYPYLIEFADSQVNSDSGKSSPFPVEKQKLFMEKWVELVFDSDCPVMQEDRWESWREVKAMGEFVNPALVNEFKENFLNWLFSNYLNRKKVII